MNYETELHNARAWLHSWIEADAKVALLWCRSLVREAMEFTNRSAGQHLRRVHERAGKHG